MNKASRLPDYLGHILEAFERIEEYVSDMDEMAFLDSAHTQPLIDQNIVNAGHVL